MWDSSGFWVTETEAPIDRCVSGAVFYREAEHFAIEELHIHSLNVISF